MVIFKVENIRGFWTNFDEIKGIRFVIICKIMEK